MLRSNTFWVFGLDATRHAVQPIQTSGVNVGYGIVRNEKGEVQIYLRERTKRVLELLNHHGTLSRTPCLNAWPDFLDIVNETTGISQWVGVWPPCGKSAATPPAGGVVAMRCRRKPTGPAGVPAADSAFTVSL